MPSHLGPTFSLERAWTGFSLYAHKLRCLQCTQKIIILPNISSSLTSRYNCKLYIYNMPRPLYVIQKEKLRSNIFVCVGGGRGGGEAKQIYLQPCYLLLYFLQMHLYC